jgi:eukaryotic-like serine/threonine-protein kinase
LTIELRKPTVGSYRCPGADETLSDFSVVADVTLGNANTCAGVWFRFTDDAGGYALLVCADRYELVSHIGGRVTSLKQLFSGDAPTPVGQPIRVAIRTKGNLIWFYRDGKMSPQISDEGRFTAGRTVLGVFPAVAAAVPPFRVSFANVEIWRVPVS